ncbi:MAG: hypothetical protein U0M50_05755 [Paramuribaculum sp.]
MCERNCPNGTITLTTKMVDTADGKKKRKPSAVSTILVVRVMVPLGQLRSQIPQAMHLWFPSASYFS